MESSALSATTGREVSLKGTEIPFAIATGEFLAGFIPDTTSALVFAVRTAAFAPLGFGTTNSFAAVPPIKAFVDTGFDSFIGAGRLTFPNRRSSSGKNGSRLAGVPECFD